MVLSIGRGMDCLIKFSRTFFALSRCRGLDFYLEALITRLEDFYRNPRNLLILPILLFSYSFNLVVLGFDSQKSRRSSEFETLPNVYDSQ